VHIIFMFPELQQPGDTPGQATLSTTTIEMELAEPGLASPLCLLQGPCTTPPKSHSLLVSRIC